MRSALRRSTLISTTLTLFAVIFFALTASAQYKVTNLVSDGSVPAVTTDAQFINPWAFSTSGTWWISAQGTGLNFVTSATTSAVSFKVVVPAQSGLTTATGLPTGSATTGGAAGMILTNGTKASFLFSTLDGTISGWNSKLGTAGAISQIMINNNAAGAVYTDLAILNNSTATVSYILAPNFGTGKVDIFDSTFKPATLAGNFLDPNLPANYVPYAIHIIGAKVYVTYAVRTAAKPFREVVAPGNGIVSVFDSTGVFLSRIATGGNLNEPWGVAIAPANYGIYSNDILIGNFGDGKINVYDPVTFNYVGQLMDGGGNPLVYASLWELLPGGTTVTGTTGVSGGDTSTVYFTAGLAGEVHGLLGAISNDTSAGTPSFGFSTSQSVATVTAGSIAQASLAIEPTYKFTGTVTFSCSGLPVSATCIFSPSQLTVSPTASAIGTVTIATTKASASLRPFGSNRASAVSLAMLLPAASLLVFLRRKRNGVLPLRLLCLALFLVATTGLITSCADNGTLVAPAATPAGQSTVVITATNGTITKTTNLTLNVQ